MKKKNFYLMLIALSGSIGLLSAQEVKVLEKPAVTTIKPTTDVVVKKSKSIEVLGNSVVPPNQVYYVFDNSGNAVDTLKAGDIVGNKSSQPKGKGGLSNKPNSGNQKKPMDCYIIECPPQFSGNTVCWKCKARD